ncbi:MAG: PTS sugar transporter subunit IIB [Bacilli bacterium]
MPVTVMRIDDRLIHGQIVTRWIAAAEADVILIADDKAASDSTQQMLLKLVAPTSIKLLIKSLKESAEILADKEQSKGKILLMVRNPQSALELLNLGFQIDTINVGNISNSKSETGRTKLLNYVFVEENDVICLKEISKKGVGLDIRAVPNDKTINGLDLISRF